MLSAASKTLSAASRYSPSRLCRRFSSAVGDKHNSQRVESLCKLQENGMFSPEQKVLTCGEHNFYLACLFGQVMGPCRVIATSPDPIGTRINTLRNLKERKEQCGMEIEEEKLIGPITKGLIDLHKLSHHIENQDLPKDFSSILYHMPRLPKTPQHYSQAWKHWMYPCVRRSYLDAIMDFIDSSDQILNGRGDILLFDDAKGPQVHWEYQNLLERNQHVYESQRYPVPWGDKSKGESIRFRRKEETYYYDCEELKKR